MKSHSFSMETTTNMNSDQNIGTKRGKENTPKYQCSERNPHYKLYEERRMRSSNSPSSTKPTTVPALTACSYQFCGIPVNSHRVYSSAPQSWLFWLSELSPIFHSAFSISFSILFFCYMIHRSFLSFCDCSPSVRISVGRNRKC